jgi:hypothetical protein
MEFDIRGWFGVCKLCTSSNRIEATSLIMA